MTPNFNTQTTESICLARNELLEELLRHTEVKQFYSIARRDGDNEHLQPLNRGYRDTKPLPKCFRL